MKRVALVGALALMFLLVPSRADAQDTGHVSFVNASTGVALDLYVGGSGDSAASLAAANVTLSQVVDLGQLSQGSWRFLLCAQHADPLDSVVSCAQNNAGTLTDKKLSVNAGKSFEVVWSTTLKRFNIDTGCVSPGGRLTVGNVAASGPATVSLDGEVLNDNFSNGKIVKTNVSAGSHDLAVSDGGALNLSGPVAVASQVNTVVYVTGDGGQFATTAHQVALDCGTPPPTDPTPTTASTTPAAAVNASTTSPGVNPRYAG